MSDGGACPRAWLEERPDITVSCTQLPHGEHGRWYPALRVILLQEGLTASEERQTLAHEIAHVLRGDPYGDPEQEANTDRLAELIFN